MIRVDIRKKMSTTRAVKTTSITTMKHTVLCLVMPLFKLPKNNYLNNYYW